MNSTFIKSNRISDELINRLVQKGIYRYSLSKEDAEDCAIEALMKFHIYSISKNFTVGSIDGLVFRIFFNTVISLKRYSDRRRDINLNIVDKDGYEYEESVIDDYAIKDYLEHLGRVISNLPRKSKAIMEMVCLGYDAYEIAQMSSVPYNTIKSRVFKARKMILGRI